jgi:PAS domain S-box-containing protein
MEDVLATHKQVEHALRYLGTIAEQTTEGVAVLDPAGLIQFVNPAWVTMHGSQTTNDFIGRPITAFLAEEQKKADGMAFVEQAMQRGRNIGLVEHLKSDGTSFLAQMKMTVVKDEAGRTTGFVVLAVDITQRRRLEEMLRNNTRRSVQFAERIACLQKLLVEARDVEESLTKQATELDADSQELRKRIAQWAQSQEMPIHSMKISRNGGPPLPRPKREHKESPESPQTEKAERLQAEEAFETDPQRRPKQEGHQYRLNTEELRKVAELGRRLAGLTR